MENLDKQSKMRYSFSGASSTLKGNHKAVGGWLSIFGGQSFALGKGAVPMVTYGDLYLLLTLIVTIIALVVEITTKKK